MDNLMQVGSIYCEDCGERKGTPRNIDGVTTYICDVCYDPGYQIDLEEYRRGER